MIYRYRLPTEETSSEKIVNGTLLYNYRWVYSKNKLDLPGVTCESARTMSGFAEGSVNAKTRATAVVNIKKKEVSEESVEEPKVVNYHKLKKAGLIGLLIEKGFSEKEYKGKVKSKLIELLELEEELNG